MMHQEDADECEIDERVATPPLYSRDRSPEEAFPYLRIPQLTVAGRPHMSPLKIAPPCGKTFTHSRKRSVSHEIERYHRRITKEREDRRYPWISSQAEKRLAEIERQITAKLAPRPRPAKTIQSELTRHWVSLSLGKRANYLEFISVLAALNLIQGSEVALINSLWTTVGGDQKQGVTLEELANLFDVLEAEVVDETRCSDSECADTPTRRARRRN